MSVTLYLVRHGIAEDQRAGLADTARALTEEGHRKMRQTAEGLRVLGIEAELILSSPLVRARQTAEVLAEVLEAARDPLVHAPLAPGGSPEEVLAELTDHAPARSIFLVGHQPDMGELASYLLTGTPTLAPLPFKKGAIAAISLASLAAGRPGVLEWFAPSRLLRRL